MRYSVLTDGCVVLCCCLVACVLISCRQPNNISASNSGKADDAVADLAKAMEKAAVSSEADKPDKAAGAEAGAGAVKQPAAKADKPVKAKPPGGVADSDSEGEGEGDDGEGEGEGEGDEGEGDEDESDKPAIKLDDGSSRTHRGRGATSSADAAAEDAKNEREATENGEVRKYAERFASNYEQMTGELSVVAETIKSLIEHASSQNGDGHSKLLTSIQTIRRMLSIGMFFDCVLYRLRGLRRLNPLSDRVLT